MPNMSVENARARFGSGGSRGIDEPVRRPRLPQADSWDPRTGNNQEHELSIVCHWAPLDTDWAKLTIDVMIAGKFHRLGNDAIVKRVYRVVRGQTIEGKDILVLAYLKQALASCGISEVSLIPDDTFCNGLPRRSVLCWKASFKSRLSVAWIENTNSRHIGSLALIN